MPIRRLKKRSRIRKMKRRDHIVLELRNGIRQDTQKLNKDKQMGFFVEGYETKKRTSE